MDQKLIAIDWGSTNCRASLLSEDGEILEQQDEYAGVFALTQGDTPPYVVLLDGLPQS